jgi:hypothetical protein
MIISAVGAGAAAFSVSEALYLQFGSATILFVVFIAVIGVFVSLCALIGTESLSGPAITSMVVAGIMWLTVGLGLIVNPPTVTIAPETNVMHVMPDSTTHFPGSSYERALWHTDVGDVAPLTYETSVYTSNEEVLGQTGISVNLRTSYIVSVQLAPNSALAEQIRGYMSQDNVSIERIFEVISSRLASRLLGHYMEEHPNTPVRTGLRLPYNIPWIDSMTVIKISEQIAQE